MLKVVDRLAALTEAHRVLRPAGRLLLIEPNVYSPLALLQALSIPAERGILRSTEAQLRRELGAAGFAVTAARAEQVEFERARRVREHFGVPELLEVLIRG